MVVNLKDRYTLRHTTGLSLTENRTKLTKCLAHVDNLQADIQRLNGEYEFIERKIEEETETISSSKDELQYLQHNLNSKSKNVYLIF